MSVKRKAGFGDDRGNKRSRGFEVDSNKGAGYEIKSRLDPVTGQRGAFPGLEGDGDSDSLFYGPAEDGLEYLRMVRAEASTVPSMLVAANYSQNQKMQDAGSGARRADFAKLWADEAIIAESTGDVYDDWAVDEDKEEEKEAQDAYYEALLERFARLRMQLSRHPPKQSPPEQINPAVQRALDITSSFKQWQYGLSSCAPSPQFISRLSQRQVILGLERLEILLTRRNLERPFWRTNLGAWCWSLLAKSRDKSELDGDDIGVLRSLAKCAQRLGSKLRTLPASTIHDVEAEDIADYEEDFVEGEVEAGKENEDENVSADADNLEAARARLLGIFDSDLPAADGPLDPLAETSESLEPVVMLLDSIVTLVGELYGQRDLLEQRAAW